MTFSSAYVKELEDLISDVLLPVYEQHCGEEHKLSGLKEQLLGQIRAKKKLPALLKKKHDNKE